MMLPPSPISTQWSLFCRLNPLKPDSSNCYSLPSRPYLPFLNFWHSGTLALSLLTLLTRLLSAECLSARMSEINYGRLDPYGAEHSKCNHMITLGFKGLTLILNSFVFTSLRASYLARVCTDVDIPHCVVIHSVHDLHAVRTSKFWRSNANVDSIDLHAALRHLRLHRKQETQEMKHRNVTSLYFAILLRLTPLTDGFQKTRMIALSRGIKISTVHCLVLSQSTRKRRVDRRTGHSFLGVHSGHSEHPGAQNWASDCPSVKKIKTGLDQYGAERCGRLTFATIKKVWDWKS